jgi:DNA polymerase-3 subunit epsilon
MKRQLFVDTETTGLNYNKGHRVIELGVVEMVNRKLTGSNLHFYFKPDIMVEKEALKVHGISNEFLKDKPLFSEKFNEILHYFNEAELVMHNARFDLGFLNWELSLLKVSPWEKIDNHCQIVDTLAMARKKHPGQKNSLDALCTRYSISNKHRKLHGALLDAKILAEVYLMMTGGQTDLFSELVNENRSGTKEIEPKNHEGCKKLSFAKAKISEPSQKKHEEYLALLDKKSNNNTLWRKL